MKQRIYDVIYIFLLLFTCIIILWFLLGKPKIIHDCIFCETGLFKNETYKEYYINGKRKFILETENCIANGSVKYFYENGKLKVSGNYKKGSKIGIFYIYDSLGQDFAVIDFGSSNKFNPLIKIINNKDTIIYEIKVNGYILRKLGDYSPQNLKKFLKEYEFDYSK